MNLYFQLYANCIVTKGQKRAIIADLQNGWYTFIPNLFADILLELKKKTLASFCFENSKISLSSLKEELDKLEECGLGHYLNEISLFPEIDHTFKTPYLIQDCIIELSPVTMKFSDTILSDLTLLGCQSLELRSYNEFDFEELTFFLSKLSNTRIRGVEIYTKYKEGDTMETYIDFMIENPIVLQITIHGCNNNKLIQHSDEKIVVIEENLNSNKCCGNISPKQFKVNLQFYLESLKHNTCLNRKISIDENGIIKNCPSQKKGFGNIKDVSLVEALNLPEFKRLWKMNKEKIDICKSCEFRRICSDCRVYVENVKDINSKPLKCGYNPETTMWEDWAKNPLKQKYFETSF